MRNEELKKRKKKIATARIFGFESKESVMGWVFSRSLYTAR